MLKDDREEAEKCGDNAKETYKVKYMHGADRSLKFGGHISIEP